MVRGKGGGVPCSHAGTSPSPASCQPKRLKPQQGMECLGMQRWMKEEQGAKSYKQQYSKRLNLSSSLYFLLSLLPVFFAPLPHFNPCAHPPTRSVDPTPSLPILPPTFFFNSQDVGTRRGK